MTHTKDIVIFVPPFASVTYPALGPSLLAAACQKIGYSCGVQYGNVDYCAFVGFDTYQKISQFRTPEMIGELLFRQAAFPNESQPTIAERISEVRNIQAEHYLDWDFGNELSDAELELLLESIEPFVSQSVEKILARHPKIVGFSTVFQQTLACFAVARRIKTMRPDLQLILGGANVSVPMGPALAKLSNTFNHYFSGEADYEFPQFCDNYLKNGGLPEETVVECEAIYQMDSVPTPFYDDYFEQIKEYVSSGRLPPQVPECLHFESSRGCWWGQKKHCTFCGLNGQEMGYRRKSTTRILKEIKHLRNYYNCHVLHATDNIMPYEFHHDVLPALADSETKISLFYEVKANLKSRDLDSFLQAGVTLIQPGIESFSSNVLSHIGKGVSGQQNVVLLRDCASRGIQVIWNLLSAIPGELAQNYEDTILLLPNIEHFQPPTGTFNIMIDRYSPYHTHPERYGMQNLRPLPAYYNLFPKGTPVQDIAYHFESDYETAYTQDKDLQTRLKQLILDWRNRWRLADKPILYAKQMGSGIVAIEDTRRVAQERFCIIAGDDFRLLESLEKPSRKPPNHPMFEEFCERRFIIQHEGYFFSVVTKHISANDLWRDSFKPPSLQAS